MSNITLTILALVIGVWVYSIISILNNEFKSKKAKTFWIIAIVFIPLLSFFYIFLKKDLLK